MYDGLLEIKYELRWKNTKKDIAKLLERLVDNRVNCTETRDGAKYEFGIYCKLDEREFKIHIIDILRK